MSWAANEVVSVLVFLLPGLVASAMFYSPTSHPKPNEFGQVVQGLIFTTVSQAVAWAARWAIRPVWPEFARPDGWELFFPVLVAAAVAPIPAVCSNHETIHRILRQANVSRETSYPSEWYSAFAENNDSYVVLHFQDGRRLYGWPEEWPSHPSGGHVVIAEGEWLIDGERNRATGASAILVSAGDLKMVEFVEAEFSEREGSSR